MSFNFTLAATATAVTPDNPPGWGAIQQLNTISLRRGLRSSTNWQNCVQISHAMDVAQAMGNWPEYRRQRAQLIAHLW